MPILESNDRAQLRRFLEERFSLDELVTLAFDLGLSYQALPHETTAQLSRELVEYFERRKNLGCLCREVLRQRYDPTLAQLCAKLPPDFVHPYPKVQIIIAADIQLNPNEIIEDLAAKLKISVDQVELVGAAWGSLRLLLGLPKEAYDLLLRSDIQTLVKDRYAVMSVTAFDLLDEASQKAWRLLAAQYPLWPPVPWKSPGQTFEFVNRLYELDKICKPGAPRFVLIDGPAGYGKSYLLYKIKKIYESQVRVKWKAAVIDLKSDPVIHSLDPNLACLGIVRAVVRQFGAEPDIIDLELPPKDVIPGALVPFPARQQANILLLFDGIEVLSPGVSEWLSDSISDLEQGLTQRPRKLRVVLAGRYVRDWEWRPPYSLTRIPLSPFHRPAVRDMVEQVAESVGEEADDRYKDELSWWVLLLSGGHPRAIRDLLTIICDSGFIFPNLGSVLLDVAFRHNGQRGPLFDLCTEPTIQELVGAVNPSLKEALTAMGPIRRFNADLLQDLLDHKHINTPDYATGWDLLRELQNTHLISPPMDDPMYSDQIVRRMLAMKQLLKNPERSKQIGEAALTIFHRWALDSTSQDEIRRVAILESLFLTVQLDFIDERLFRLRQEGRPDPAQPLAQLLQKRLHDYLESVNRSGMIWQLQHAFCQDEELNAWIEQRAGSKAVSGLMNVMKAFL